VTKRIDLISRQRFQSQAAGLLAFQTAVAGVFRIYAADDFHRPLEAENTEHRPDRADVIAPGPAHDKKLEKND